MSSARAPSAPASIASPVAAPSECIESSSASASAADSSGWYRICSLAEIPVGGAKCSDVAGRPVVLFRTAGGGSSKSSPGGASPSSSSASAAVLPDQSRLWAMDRVCYHMGGPLDQGDIEDIAGQLVVTCPWHRYKISLAAGEGLYQAAPGAWKSKGVRQRTHAVRWAEAADEVQVRLDTTPGDCPSDEYNAPDRYAALQTRLAKATHEVAIDTSNWWSSPPVGVRAGAGTSGPGLPRSSAGPLGAPPAGYQRSGHLFAANRASAAASKAASGEPQR